MRAFPDFEHTYFGLLLTWAFVLLEHIFSPVLKHPGVSVQRLCD